MNTATLISIYFWDVKDIVLTLKRSETFETFIGIVKSNQEKIQKGYDPHEIGRYINS